MSEKRKQGSNREIMYTTWFFAVLFIAMIGYLVYFTASGEQEMLNNSYNSRQQLLASQNYRGSILASGKEVLAQTTLDAAGNETRVYPYGALFSHIIGYSTKGRTGVEALGNYYLINSSTSLSNKAANDAAGLKNPGDNIYTTLDVTLQQAASDGLGNYKGAVVVTQVKTGQILAMVSKPDFDPNRISAVWNELISDTSSSVLVNRATQGLYPPGSTFKIVTALEYIRENTADYDQYHFNCTGSYTHSGRRISCYHGTSHGNVDFYSSFAKSCNASFANIGMSLNRSSFADTLSGLLFNESLPLTLSYSQSSLYVSEDTSDAEMMQISIGQGTTQITPMHLNMITMSIANQGILMKPYVMDRVVNDNGTVIKSFRPEAYGQLMSAKEADILTQLMKEVVQTGTARGLKSDSYTAAGKTGSAEYNNTKSDSHAWFTGFAPAEDPQIAVTVIVEGAGSGSEYAVPIAKKIMDTYFAETAVY